MNLKDIFNLITGSYGADQEFPHNVRYWDGEEDLMTFIDRRLEYGYPNKKITKVDKKKWDKKKWDEFCKRIGI